MIRAPVVTPLRAPLRPALGPLQGELPRYSDGSVAYDLVGDASYFGEASTVAAIDALNALLHTTLTPTYWNPNW
jgi:hypothetical protein